VRTGGEDEDQAIDEQLAAARGIVAAFGEESR
jgi:hypothetical protein